MHRLPGITLTMVLALSVVWLGTMAVAAHGDEEGAASVVLEPAAVAPGGSVLVVGTELEPEMETLLQLKGEGLTMNLGSVSSTAEGRFSEEVVVPAHLPAGVYQLEAIGEETITVELQVVGSAEEGAVPTAASGLSDGEARDRGVVELGFVIVLAAAAAAVGLFLVLRAERLGHAGADQEHQERLSS